MVLDRVWLIGDWTIFTQILLEARHLAIHFLNLINQVERCIGPEQRHVFSRRQTSGTEIFECVCLLSLFVVEVCECRDAVVLVAGTAQFERKSRGSTGV